MTRDPQSASEDIADTAAELAELRATAEDILSHAWSVDRTRVLLDSPGPAYDPAMWKTVLGLGWPDVLVPESVGGGGAGLRELCALSEAVGAIALPVPLAATAAAGWCERRCADGMSLLLPDPDATVSGGRVTGDWPLVPFGAVADRFVLLATIDGARVLISVDTRADGVEREAERPLDHNPASRVVLVDAPFDLVDAGDAAAQRHRAATHRAHLAAVAELIGIASAANDAAVEYAKVRVTFGEPIGARQAVKHRLVDQRCAIEVARALVNRAADACEIDHPDADPLVSLAAFWAIDSLRRVPEGATQVFGGIAYTWEHDAHVHLRRAATSVAMLGSRSHHRAVVASWLKRR